MLARVIATLKAARVALASAKSAVLNIEAEPVADGSVKVVKMSRPVVDESGKAVRDMTADPVLYPNGKVVRESFAVEVPVSRSSQYRKAIRNRRNAAERVARAERAFALAVAELPVAEVKAAVVKLA
jgi:hypothetical protein